MCIHVYVVIIIIVTIIIIIIYYSTLFWQIIFTVMAEQDTKKKKSIPDSQDVPAEQNIHVSDGSQNLMTYHGMSKCEEETRRVALRTSSIYTSPHTDQHSHDLDKWFGF